MERSDYIIAFLKKAVDQRCNYLVTELTRSGYFKNPARKQLYELTLSELEEIYKAQKQK
ncbi:MULTISPECIES: Fur-regulated basic protein FbpA [Priestia]|uniref:Fur-regulated basic protein FbpA n=1 Tax=Priestia TaxID=2800373 RepID=UPI00356B703F